MVLKASFRHSASTVAVACFLAHAPSAMAEYPGEMWSVDSVSIKMVGDDAAGLTKAALRSGLQQANDVYFFGEESVRMQAEVSGNGSPKLRLTLIKQSGGAVVARSPLMAVAADGSSIQARALAWMETLNCAQAGCAAAPEAVQPVRVAKARLDVRQPERMSSDAAVAEAGQIMAGIPIPVSRPAQGGTTGKRGKAKLGGSGLAGKDLGFSAVPIQIALSVPREVGALTYTDADQLIVDDTIQLARLSPLAPVAAAPVRPVRTVPKAAPADDSLVGRWLSQVADFFGIKPAQQTTGTAQPAAQVTAQTSVQPKAEAVVSVPSARSSIPETSLAAAVPVPEPTQTLAPSAWQRASDSVTLVNPIDRFRPAGSITSVTDGERIALADIPARLTDPANARASTDLIEVPSTQELLVPSNRPVARTAGVVQTPRVTRTNLSVRLHPDLLGRYAGGTRVASAQSQRQVASPSRRISGAALDDSSKLSQILSERGMEIDVAGHNRFERIYSSGTEEEGFWISMPNRIDAKFALVSGPDASVIVAVRRRNGISRASAGVAEALGLRPREWAKLRVVALRATNRSASLPSLDWFTTRKGRNLIQ